MEELSPRAQAKADQVRHAAQKLFLAHGVGATSMDAITSEAGVSKQTVYTYFPSKEALLSAVLHGLVGQRAHAWEQRQSAQGQLDSWTALEAELAQFGNQVIKALMDVEYLATARVIVAEAGSSPEYGELFRKSVAEPVLKAVTAIIRRAVDDGLLAEAPHEDVARMYVGSLLTFVLLDGLLRADDIKRPSPRRVRRLTGFFIDALQAAANSRALS